MPLLITQSSPALQRVTDIPMSGIVADVLRCDATGWGAASESFSLVVPVIVNEPGNTPFQKVVFEATNGANLIFALIYESDGDTYWRFSWHVGDGQPKLVGENIGFNPDGRVCAVSLSYQKRSAGAFFSRLRMCVFVPGMAATNFAETSLGGTALAGPPTSWGIGANLANVAPLNANMRGLIVLWVMRPALMNGLIVADGRELSDGVASVDVKSLVFPSPGTTDFCGAPSRYPAALAYALNASCSGRMWNDFPDCRPGKSTPACSVIDHGAVTFPAYWNRSNGASFIGSINHVNPYTWARIPRLPPPANTSLQSGITGEFSNVGPLGQAGPAAERFVAAAGGSIGGVGTFAGQLSVLFAANSRGVTAGAPAELMLSDGTFAGRKLFSTYPEAGIASIKSLWNGGLVGMSNLPIPTGLYEYGADAQETGDDATEPLFGVDCATERPLCRDLVHPHNVAVKEATIKLVDSTYSRVWGGSRYATRIDGQANRFRGNGAPRSVKIGYSYRLLVRPESGLPNAEGLEVGFYVLRNPMGSSFWFSKAAAASQLGDSSLNSLTGYWTSDMDAHNVSSAPILSYSPATFADDLTVSGDGWVVIDNRSGAMTPAHVGQWLEVTTSTKARRDITCITAIDNSVPEECRVYYEGGLQHVPSFHFDLAHWLTVPGPRYTRATLTFAPNEASDWRGITLGVSSWVRGNGADLLGVQFRNTSRPGVIAGQVARSGCGFTYQLPRFFHTVSPVLGTSPFQEMVRLINPDLLICCTADQGDNVTFADRARNGIKAYVQAWQAAKPNIEPALYSTGPEFRGEQDNDDVEDAKASYHVAYAQAAADLGIPHLSVYYDLVRGTGCMNSFLTGENTESRTHPSTSFDVRRMVEQFEAALPAPCPADFNQDGGVDGGDVEAFYRAWQMGDPSADVNLDGGVDGSDVETFFRAWEAGGC